MVHGVRTSRSCSPAKVQGTTVVSSDLISPGHLDCTSGQKTFQARALQNSRRKCKTIFRNLAACQTASAASPHLSNLALPSLPPSCSFFLLSSSNTVFILSCKGPAHSCVQEIQVLDSFHQLSSIAPRLTQIKPRVSLSAASNSVADFIAISNTSVVTSLSSTRPQFLLSLAVKESGSSLLRLKLNNYFFLFLLN